MRQLLKGYFGFLFDENPVAIVVVIMVFGAIVFMAGSYVLTEKLNKPHQPIVSEQAKE